MTKGHPELVAPAGNLEKLKTALNFGADAVYLGGQEYSLRAMADNFSMEDLREGLGFAHDLGRRVYVTVNILAHNRDIEALPAYLDDLAGIGVDGLIISDPGVLILAQKHCPNTPVTMSTQSNITNYLSAGFYLQQGVKRLVLARELNMGEISEIKKRVPVELEVFIHGAMCLSYSGRCWLSEALTGRDANQGLCAHPCRYQYALLEEKRPGQYFPVYENERGTYVMNSKDLCLVEYIGQLIEVGVDAFKIEGRMKSAYYVASVVKTYRDAIDAYLNGEPADPVRWKEDLARVATRPFTTGFALGDALNTMDFYKESMARQVLFCGIVRNNDAKGRVLIEQRAPFRPGDSLEYLVPGESVKYETAGLMYNAEGEAIDVARHPKEWVWLASRYMLPAGSLVGRLADVRQQ